MITQKVVIASKQNRVQIHDARLEHLDIINTLIDKNYEKAAILMKTHIETCRRAALDYFYSMESYNTISPETYKNHLENIVRRFYAARSYFLSTNGIAYP